jgi:hypothetical protein
LLTLAGGAMFGLLLGHADRLLRLVDRRHAGLPDVALPAARLGACSASASACGDRRGRAREGAFYLFTLRLVPAFPFFLVNLLIGLTR